MKKLMLVATVLACTVFVGCTTMPMKFRFKLADLDNRAADQITAGEYNDGAALGATRDAAPTGGQKLGAIPVDLWSMIFTWLSTVDRLQVGVVEFSTTGCPNCNPCVPTQTPKLPGPRIQK